MHLAPALRRLIPARAVRALRPLNRLRWLAKAGQARRYGASWGNDPVGVARYVLWDPEVGDFSYDLANREVFAAELAEMLEVPTGRVLKWFAEAESHPELSGRLIRRLRGRWDLHSRAEFGPRLGWYALVRAARPAIVVETGIKHGIGSLLLLVALELNAHEGHPGVLVSIDDDPAAGSLVPAGRFANWERVTGRSPQDLEPALAGREVHVLIQDTPAGAGVEAAEYALALAHGSGPLWLASGNGAFTPVLADLAANHDGSYRLVPEQPRHPIYPGGGMAFARIPRRRSH